MIDVQIIPILEDNYSYLITAADGMTAVIDPGDAQPIIEALEAKGSGLDYVINTHHHWDHTDGNEELVNAYGAKLVGPATETDKISGLDILLSDGEEFAFGSEAFQIIETPGHTTGHIVFYAPNSGILFSGDTLFLMGCGRLFEGTAEQMWNSFQKLSALPDDTLIYCGHEYTLGNGTFCERMEPENQALKRRMDNVRQLRARNERTIPGKIGEEKKTNIFMRAQTPERFAELRSLKDKS